MKRAVEFYSEGFKLCGDIYVPNDLQRERLVPVFCYAMAIQELKICTCPTMPEF